MKLVHQQLQYIEFVSSDLPRIRAFYEAAFGWVFTEYGPEYLGFEGENVDGGFAAGEPASGSILPIVYSNTLEATLDRVVDAGGTIVQEIYEFPGGRRFHFTDPDGNELAVWSEL